MNTDYVCSISKELHRINEINKLLEKDLVRINEINKLLEKKVEKLEKSINMYEKNRSIYTNDDVDWGNCREKFIGPL